MNRQEYLNEISASTRPATPKRGSKILSSKFFWVGVIGIGAFIIMAIIGGIISGSSTNAKDQLYSLILHLDNTSELIQKYQPSIKSSDLRSYGTSLNNIVSSSASDLTNYATEKYNFKPKEVKKSITDEETSAKDALDNELFNAKISGTLDRIFAQKFAYEISLIGTRESQLIKASSDSTLQDILTKSYNNLSNLYDNFNNFSEAK